jgi:hypothetical protein
MNDILHIKGPFEHKNNSNIPGAPQLSSKSHVSLVHLKKLQSDLSKIAQTYESQTNKIIQDALVSVYYNKVAAKSNRTSVFLTAPYKKSNDTIVGAKFSETGNHIITHYVPLTSVYKAIQILEMSIQIAETYFEDPITSSEFNQKEKFDSIPFDKRILSKSVFQNTIVDVSYIESFGIEYASYHSDKDAVVTFYRTETIPSEIFKKINLSLDSSKIIDSTTVVLSKNEIQILLEAVPYLVAMTVDYLSNYSPGDFADKYEEKPVTIDEPNGEPIIGVIDTLFDDRVYFHKWVDYRQILSGVIATERDKTHGTRISSILVDGPRLNPHLEDGCGNFRVRHFGIATAGKTSSITIMREIRKIVIGNPDIKVWNLSLGSNEEIHRNFVSIEAASLDQLQFEQNVLFVISGTNDPESTKKKIGAPADSINAVVVNSVNPQGKPAEYSRRGPVLDFFTKPDISYYGGTTDQRMRVCDANGEAFVCGTSYAAPWIARKLAYLIDVMGFGREIAKALLIDSAIGWKNSVDPFVGHGVVPIRIEEIIKSKKEEIRFVLSGIAKKYNTYNYRFPIPFYHNEYPFVARATLCYFPKCSRNQGVDYTNTELDLYFGRLLAKDKLDSINKNKQSTDEGPVTEELSRKDFGKWDNVKHLQDVSRSNPKGKKVYPAKLWGMRIVSKERIGQRDEEGIRFGVVVTLKDIYGMNRIEDFIQLFSFNGWIVNRINVENRIDIYTKAEESVRFE